MFDSFVIRGIQRGLSADDAELLRNSYLATSRFEAKSYIVDQDVPTNRLHILLVGWACKYKVMADGRRQLIAVHLPGEICDLDKIYQDDLGFGVMAISECQTASIAVSSVRDLIEQRATIRDFFWSSTVRENAALIATIAMVGHSPRQRIAYLISDLMFRLEALKEGIDGAFRIELRQEDFADLLGISTVHVNRTIQGMKAEGLFEVNHRQWKPLNRSALDNLAEFDRLDAVMSFSL